MNPIFFRYMRCCLKCKYPKAFAYISCFEDKLLPKKVKYKTNPKYWYSLHRAREKQLFDSVKIITPQLQNYPNFALDTQSMYTDAGGYILIINDDYKDDVLYYYGILNSSLFYHFITNTSTAFNNNYYYFKTAYIEPFRFPDENINTEKETIKKNVDLIMKNRSMDNDFDISLYEREIDLAVYRLYGITEEERNGILEKYNVR